MPFLSGCFLFILSLPFYSREKVLLVDEGFFTAFIMLAFISAYLFFLFRHLSKLTDQKYFFHALSFAAVVLFLNIILDYAVVILVFGVIWSDLISSTLPAYITLFVISYFFARAFQRI